MLLFSFSIFSDRRSLKIENENKSAKTLTAEVSYTGSLELSFLEICPGWLDLPLTGINFHGPKPVRTLKFYCICFYLDILSYFIYAIPTE